MTRWKTVPLATVAMVQGGIQKQPKRAPAANAYPFLRVANVTATGLDLSDVHRIELFAGELERFRLEYGDLLVVEGNGSPEQVGRAAMWNGSIPDSVHQNHLIRVRPVGDLYPRYLEAVWNSPQIRQTLSEISSSTSGLHTLSVTKLQRLHVPLPPLEEQRRIVDILEDHLSRLDAATSLLDASSGRSRKLGTSVLLDLIPDVSRYPARWQSVTVAEAGLVELGRQRHPDWHTGDNMHPYLRVANVFEDHIDSADVMEMHWPGESFDRFRLAPGDVLLNEGQSPEWLGRPAVYRGVPEDVAFTNSLIRFRAGSDVLPEFALLVFRRHMHAGRFMRESRITTNIAHLSATRLKAVEFPIPPLREQAQIVARAGERLDAVEQMRAGVRAATTRSVSLRRALLAAAFSGQLTGRSSDLDIAEELMPA